VNGDEFAKRWKAEMHNFLSEEYIYMKAGMLGTPTDHLSSCRAMLTEVLNDTFYSLLLGLDGAVSIGESQIRYEIRDESGNLVSDGNGLLEAAAWKAFHESNT
jgi:hypothetical protein